MHWFAGCFLYLPKLGGPSQLSILADGAYKDDARFTAPFDMKAIRMSGPLMASRMYAYNRRLRAIRVSVEWVFARLKMWWYVFPVVTLSSKFVDFGPAGRGILRGQWSLSRDWMDKIFRTCCVLTNYLFRIRGSPPASNPHFNLSLFEIHEDDHL